MLKYILDYEWLCQDGDEIVVGIIVYVSEQLGDVVFVELFEVGCEVDMGEEIVVIEFVKVVLDIVVFLVGVIIVVNDVLFDMFGLVNDDLLMVWFFCIKFSNFDLLGFLDEDVYQQLIG